MPSTRLSDISISEALIGGLAGVAETGARANPMSGYAPPARCSERSLPSPLARRSRCCMPGCRGAEWANPAPDASGLSDGRSPLVASASVVPVVHPMRAGCCFRRRSARPSLHGPGRRCNTCPTTIQGSGSSPEDSNPARGTTSHGVCFGLFRSNPDHPGRDVELLRQCVGEHAMKQRGKLAVFPFQLHQTRLRQPENH